MSETATVERVSFSQAVLDQICRRLSAGETLKHICRDDGMPDPATVWQWRADSTEVWQQIARARELGAAAIGEDMLAIADTPQHGLIRTVTTEPDGKETVKEQSVDMIEHRKLQVQSRQWLMERFDAKSFGKQPSTVLNVGVAVSVALPEQRRAELLKLKQQAIDAQLADSQE